jgi:hypothetical protein
MNLDKLNRINIDMKDGREWLGVKTIGNNTSERLLPFEHEGSLVIVNWSDVKEAHFYEGED